MSVEQRLIEYNAKRAVAAARRWQEANQALAELQARHTTEMAAAVRETNEALLEMQNATGSIASWAYRLRYEGLTPEDIAGLIARFAEDVGADSP